jgi:ferredoxin
MLNNKDYLKELQEIIWNPKNKKPKNYKSTGRYPKFIRSKCKSYGDCLDVCPVDAITGNAKAKNIKIDLKKCIQCDSCIDVCKANAIVPA